MGFFAWIKEGLGSAILKGAALPLQAPRVSIMLAAHDSGDDVAVGTQGVAHRSIRTVTLLSKNIGRCVFAAGIEGRDIINVRAMGSYTAYVIEFVSCLGADHDSILGTRRVVAFAAAGACANGGEGLNLTRYITRGMEGLA